MCKTMNFLRVVIPIMFLFINNLYFPLNTKKKKKKLLKPALSTKHSKRKEIYFEPRFR